MNNYNLENRIDTLEYNEQFYLELPSLERKNDVLNYIEEFYKYNSLIHGTGNLDIDLKQGKTYEKWIIFYNTK